MRKAVLPCVNRWTPAVDETVEAARRVQRNHPLWTLPANAGRFRTAFSAHPAATNRWSFDAAHFEFRGGAISRENVWQGP